LITKPCVPFLELSPAILSVHFADS